MTRLGVDAASWAVEISYDLARLSVPSSASVTRMEDAVEDLRPTCEAVVLHALLALDGGVPAPITVPPETNEQIASAVRRRVPLSVILDSQRAAHGHFLDALVEEFRRLVPAEQQSQQISELSHFLVDHVSTFSSACTAAYVAEEQSWLASVDGSRGELVRALLRGDPVPGDPSKALRYELTNRAHVGLVLRRDPRDDGPQSVGLDRVAASLLSELGALGHLVIPSDGHEVWAWGSFADLRRTPVRSIGTARAALVTVGRPAVGPEGFRSTHEDAAAAARVAMLSSRKARRDRTVFYDDVQLAALLTLDLDQAARFTRDELGDLGRRGEDALRETVKVYLECNCSPANAAVQLTVARNTVVYRVKRAEELLGRSVKDRQNVLWTALYLAEMVDIPDRPPAAGGAPTFPPQWRTIRSGSGGSRR